MLARVGRRVDAARLCLLAGQLTAAMEFGRSVTAGDPSGKGRQGDLRLALAIWAEETNRFDIAAQVYEHMGQFMLAGQRYKQCALPGRAAACFERDKKYSLAAELYLQDGQPLKAGECYRALKQWQRSAECFEAAREWTLASQMYEQANDAEGIKRCQSSAQWL